MDVRGNSLDYNAEGKKRLKNLPVSRTKNGIQNAVNKLRQIGRVHSGRHPGTVGRDPEGRT